MGSKRGRKRKNKKWNKRQVFSITADPQDETEVEKQMLLVSKMGLRVTGFDLNDSKDMLTRAEQEIVAHRIFVQEKETKVRGIIQVFSQENEANLEVMR